MTEHKSSRCVSLKCRYTQEELFSLLETNCDGMTSCHVYGTGRRVSDTSTNKYVNGEYICGSGQERYVYGTDRRVYFLCYATWYTLNNNQRTGLLELAENGKAPEKWRSFFMWLLHIKSNVKPPLSPLKRYPVTESFGFLPSTKLHMGYKYIHSSPAKELKLYQDFFRHIYHKLAFIVWAIGSMRNRSNWQLTTIKHMRNVLRLIVVFS
jgi:hypothetical protein